MRVLFLNPIGQIGGAERSLLDILASLREARPSWELHLAVGADGPLIQAAAHLGVVTQVLALPPQLAELGDSASGSAGTQTGRLRLAWRLLTSAPKVSAYTAGLRRFIQEIDPDLIHTNGFKMHLLAARAATERADLCWHIHDFVSSRVAMVKLLRLHLAKASLVIANSERVASDIRRSLGAEIRVRTLLNAVNLKEFTPAGPRLDLDEASQLPPPAGDVVRIGLVATLGKWKGHQTFLRAFSKIPRDLPVRGYIVGGSLYQTEASQWQIADLKRSAEELGLTGRVGFTGFVPRPSEGMRALDVVVHASTEPEPFGLVIAEAMACRRPVIASMAGGVSEIVQDEVSCVAHRPGDVDGLAAAMMRLIRDADLRERLAAEGLRTAQSAFDRSRLGPQLVAIYEAIRDTPHTQAA